MNTIDKAVKILKKGGIVVYPTDTAYGLAADASNLAAVKKLYKLKGRDFHKPIHIIPAKDTVVPFVRMVLQAKKLMKRFWPGPLTIVLPLKSRGQSWKMLSAGTKTMGIRLPDNKLALELVRKFGKPITTTSANIAGKPNCYSIAEVEKQFAKHKLKPDFYLNGGKLRRRKPSTVVLVAGNHVKILRPGPISEKQIKKTLK